jgi:uncharacterized BrkB/YihY/UPF0761 family membrane protein
MMHSLSFRTSCFPLRVMVFYLLGFVLAHQNARGAEVQFV